MLALITAIAVSISAVTGLLALRLAFVVRHDSRARLRVTTHTFRFYDNSPHGNELYIKVQNIGGKKTAIEALEKRHYPNLSSLIMRKGRVFPVLTGGLPHEIDVGQHLECKFSQTEKFTKMVRKGWLYVAVFHTEAIKKPVYKRVKKEETPPYQELASS